MGTAVGTRGNETLAGIDSPLHARPFLKEPPFLGAWISSSPPTTQGLLQTPHVGGAELANVPLFSKLSAEKLHQLCTHSVLKSYPKHAIVINENDPSGSLYIILSGKVKTYVGDENGKELLLSIHSSGDYFGELEFIDSTPCLASAMTLERSQLCLISKTSFQGYMFEHPEIAFELLYSLAQRIRLLTEIVKSLALDSVYRRVARTLLNLATERDGQLVIEQRLTHQDIANRVGACREMVSHILKDLRAGGYIKVQDGKITIQSKLPPDW